MQRKIYFLEDLNFPSTRSNFLCIHTLVFNTVRMAMVPIAPGSPLPRMFFTRKSSFAQHRDAQICRHTSRQSHI